MKIIKTYEVSVWLVTALFLIGGTVTEVDLSMTTDRYWNHQITAAVLLLLAIASMTHGLKKIKIWWNQKDANDNSELETTVHSQSMEDRQGNIYPRNPV